MNFSRQILLIFFLALFANHCFGYKANNQYHIFWHNIFIDNTSHSYTKGQLPSPEKEIFSSSKGVQSTIEHYYSPDYFRLMIDLSTLPLIAVTICSDQQTSAQHYYYLAGERILPGTGQQPLDAECSSLTSQQGSSYPFLPAANQSLPPEGTINLLVFEFQKEKPPSALSAGSGSDLINSVSVMYQPFRWHYPRGGRSTMMDLTIIPQELLSTQIRKLWFGNAQVHPDRLVIRVVEDNHSIDVFQVSRHEFFNHVAIGAETLWPLAKASDIVLMDSGCHSFECALNRAVQRIQQIQQLISAFIGSAARVVPTEQGDKNHPPPSAGSANANATPGSSELPPSDGLRESFNNHHRDNNNDQGNAPGEEGANTGRSQISSDPLLLANELILTELQNNYAENYRPVFALWQNIPFLAPEQFNPAETRNIQQQGTLHEYLSDSTIIDISHTEAERFVAHLSSQDQGFPRPELRALNFFIRLNELSHIQPLQELCLSMQSAFSQRFLLELSAPLNHYVNAIRGYAPVNNDSTDSQQALAVFSRATEEQPRSATTAFNRFAFRYMFWENDMTDTLARLITRDDQSQAGALIPYHRQSRAVSHQIFYFTLDIEDSGLLRLYIKSDHIDLSVPFQILPEHPGTLLNSLPLMGTNLGIFYVTPTVKQVLTTKEIQSFISAMLKRGFFGIVSNHRASCDTQALMAFGWFRLLLRQGYSANTSLYLTLSKFRLNRYSKEFPMDIPTLTYHGEDAIFNEHARYTATAMESLSPNTSASSRAIAEKLPIVSAQHPVRLLWMFYQLHQDAVGIAKEFIHHFQDMYPGGGFLLPVHMGSSPHFEHRLLQRIHKLRSLMLQERRNGRQLLVIDAGSGALAKMIFQTVHQNDITENMDILVLSSKVSPGNQVTSLQNDFVLRPLQEMYQWQVSERTTIPLLSYSDTEFHLLGAMTPQQPLHPDNSWFETLDSLIASTKGINTLVSRTAQVLQQYRNRPLEELIQVIEDLTEELEELYLDAGTEDDPPLNNPGYMLFEEEAGLPDRLAADLFKVLFSRTYNAPQPEAHLLKLLETYLFHALIQPLGQISEATALIKAFKHVPVFQRLAQQSVLLPYPGLNPYLPPCADQQLWQLSPLYLNSLSPDHESHIFNQLLIHITPTMLTPLHLLPPEKQLFQRWFTEVMANAIEHGQSSPAVPKPSTPLKVPVAEH